MDLKIIMMDSRKGKIETNVYLKNKEEVGQN